MTQLIKDEMVAFLNTKSNTRRIDESDVISWGFHNAGQPIDVRVGERLVDELASAELIETVVYDGILWCRGLKEV